jgi:4-diphosphocytidyl-2-C-methyl-D-erythritol kinase
MTNRLIVDTPAKINLNLNITGKRDDGYHLLDSVVVFAALADRLTISLADADQVIITGPLANPLREGPSGGITTIHQARDAFRNATGWTAPLRLEVEKHIPIAAGLGGGSADAAATLRGMARLSRAAIETDTLMELGLVIGADVPAMLMSWQSDMIRMEGIGENLTPISLNAHLGERLGILLANPGVAVSTQEVFSTYAKSGQSFSPALPLSMIEGKDISGVILLGNDLTKLATAITPAISDLLSIMNTLSHNFGGYGAAMSGSGGTCFAIFPTPAKASEAEAAFTSATQALNYWSWSGAMASPKEGF